MKFGLHLIQQNIGLDEMRDLWRWADTAGFDWIDVSDHFYEAPLIDNRGGYHEGTVCMAALACDTVHCRVGVLVLGMNYRHPAVLANALVSIDHLSKGRLEIGLGAGWHKAEYDAYGIPFLPIKERMDILEEGIQVVRLLTTEQGVNFQGKHFTLNDATCAPPPVQTRPRIWIGGNGEKRTLRMVAKYADGWNTPYTGPEEYQRLSGVLDMWCEKEGRDPASIERNVNLSFHLAPNAAGLAAAEEDFARAWGAAAPVIRNRGVVIGTPDQAIELVGRYQEAGVARVNIAIRPPINMDALRAWTEQVIPAFS